MNRKLSIGIVGATGAVGVEICRLLAPYSLKNLVLMASKRSAGKKITFQNKSLTVVELQAKEFEGLDLVFFSAGSLISKEFVPQAVKAGAVVIDNSSAFRMDETVPLVIPEINPETISTHQGIIAVPNCTTIILWMGLFPIYQLTQFKQVLVSSYQAVSGAGQKGLTELEEQIEKIKASEPLAPFSSFPIQIAFNAIPQVDIFEENGFTKEEMKLVRESHKILKNPQLKISGTCVRVPVKRAHSESVYFRTEKKLSLSAIEKAFEQAKGVEFMKTGYPHAIACSGKHNVFVGRLRQDLQDPHGFHLWIVGDQLLKGASLNAFQIAQQLFPFQQI